MIDSFAGVPVYRLAGGGAGSSHGCMGGDDTKPGLPHRGEANMNCGGSVIISEN